MRTQGDVVVIGAGLAGLSVAYELARRGRPVRLIEAREGVALETSFANGGMMTPSMADPWNAPGVGRRLAASLFDPRAAVKLRLSAVPSLAGWGLTFLRNSAPARHRASTIAAYRLADYSRTATLDLRERLDLTFDSSSRGTMKIFRARGAFEEQCSLARMLRVEGLRHEELDAEGALRVEPLLAPVRGAIVGALHYPDDETGDAHLFCRALADRFAVAGGRFEAGVSVRGFDLSGSRIIGVRTDSGVITAADVILAAGAASRSLLTPLRLNLAIRPAKGYSLTFPPGAVPALPGVPVVDEALHAAVVPLGERLRVVGFAEFAGDDRSIHPGRIDHLMD
ncbi:MAG: FAD-dependent oxidoreductase, partial [Caulobacteraceae bacterium]